MVGAAFLVLGLSWIYAKVHWYRFKQYDYIPRVPPSLVWGHLKKLNEGMSSNPDEPDQMLGKVPNALLAVCLSPQTKPADTCADYAIADMMKSLGDPPVMLLDLRPVTLPLLVIGDHSVAEQVSRTSKAYPYSLHKSPTTYFLKALTGEHSILHAEGEEWKALRRRYNPGFAPQHLMTLLPCMLDAIEPFVAHLDALAASGDEFRMGDLCTDLTFDIIGAVTMSEDFGCQSDRQSDFIRAYRQLVESYAADTGVVSAWFQPFTTMRRRRLGRKVDPLLEGIIRAKIAEETEAQKADAEGSSIKKSAPKSRSVLALSLTDLASASASDIDALVLATRDQLKTFLFAGHDTTSIMLQWVFFELSRSPRVRDALRAELDAVLGADDPSPAAVRARLLSAEGDELVRRLTYTSAVIKEALRLYPPAATARWAPPGSGFRLRLPATKGDEERGARDILVDGLALYNSAPQIHIDEKVFGPDVAEFRPERWIGNTDTSMRTNDDDGGGGGSAEKAAGAIPATAWRPFERGPRNCIGQELANIEARVILASTVRRYDFVKVGRGRLKQPLELNDRGDWEVENRMYAVSSVTDRNTVSEREPCGGTIS